DDLLSRLLPLGEGYGTGWPALHSCWLTPEMPFAFSLALVPSVPTVHPVPHPVAGRIASPVLRAEGLRQAGSEAGRVVLASAA
ncbi:MAG: hypothetical protein M3O15_10370, partial [Acidobacteriota bacterium]|nr:hypothetical protein [Acidobacteriota bacterium]